ncbi:mannose-1-phosphate guanylyltransferase [Sunxiuqinia elliptica]|uniref:mannose-1-phosphate guanylyltransferase n=1 Tax=Sunxiuqinia elliptica TaxID=655355 RepID=A0A4V3BYT1_9BACT|nr:mannose-1-phosphate guanylyltransferase [Sunxiuqinia elliptica]TDO03739.1 mannose-1-phosphate guanylyltransferase (GDP) [Sunxiuqinia elliptica]TDO62020.1 mannose-1-phosphate guanylyltransferase (GDP) [Sunxiuqinia elliptica]
MENNFCIIMAGGIGSRFWPMSKSTMPKQFLDILGTGRTFIQMTLDRFKHICPVENIYVVTSVAYKELVMEQLPELDEHQVLLEPLRRNTAPCVAYASYKIKTINPKANIIVAPSDHLIVKGDDFVKEINKGIDYAKNNQVLVTLGITPSRPETGYGYIQIDGQADYKDYENLYKVKTFTEKPNKEMAEVFVSSGEFFWNSGIFIWSLDTILNAFETHLEDVSSLFKKGEKLYGTDDEVHFINKTYSECQNISLDYGIMEKADNVYVLCADFGWSDLGTWGSLYENSDKDEHKNSISGGEVFTYQTQNCIVNLPKDKLVVLQGLDGYIVVESDNTLLICKKEDEQQIRQFVSDVKMVKGDQFV